MRARTTSALPVLAALVIALATLSLARPARADSGVLNLHLDVGAGAPLVGPTAASYDDSAAGFAAWGSFDWQVRRPVAVELIFGGGFFTKRFPARRETSGTGLGGVGLGLRLRLLDDDRGYLNDPGGNPHSNLWFSAHLGVHSYDGFQIGVDAALGYQLSLPRPWNFGFFVRDIVLFAGDTDGVDMIFVGGLSVSVELLGRDGPLDTDGDGLSDEEEMELGTNPNRADTDLDGLDDRLEVMTGTNPRESDTDGDGLRDNQEDRNRNGRLDPDESDPRRGDTDGGGMNDLAESQDPMQDPQNPADDDRDRDGVPNDLDVCAGTERGAAVDAQGCPTGFVHESDEEYTGPRLDARGAFSLEGIHFASGSANILPESAASLREALALLRHYPAARFEIVGHTDSVGAERTNLRLSRQRAEAVQQWLFEHGVDRDRFETRGAGSAEPVDTNDTPEGRAHNRRIEFRRIGNSSEPAEEANEQGGMEFELE